MLAWTFSFLMCIHIHTPMMVVVSSHGWEHGVRTISNSDFFVIYSRNEEKYSRKVVLWCGCVGKNSDCLTKNEEFRRCMIMIMIMVMDNGDEEGKEDKTDRCTNPNLPVAFLSNPNFSLLLWFACCFRVFFDLRSGVFGSFEYRQKKWNELNWNLLHM